MDTTLDGLLNCRVALEQPAQGYRVAVDTILLAAAVPARVGDTVLDLGCGVGGAMLCVAFRVPGISVVGVEIQLELAELCRRNIARNAFAKELEIVVGDVTKIFDEAEPKYSPPLEGGVRGGVLSAKTPMQDCGTNPPPSLPLKGGGVMQMLLATFDHVLMNPPYHDEARHDVSQDAIKRVANAEKDGDLERWIASAAFALKPGGTLTLIHRADRRDEILGFMKVFFGETEILALLPKADAPARRVIIRAIKGGQASVRQRKSLILHGDGGGYTDEAENILRHAKMLDFIPVAV